MTDRARSEKTPPRRARYFDIATDSWIEVEPVAIESPEPEADSVIEERERNRAEYDEWHRYRRRTGRQ